LRRRQRIRPRLPGTDFTNHSFGHFLIKSCPGWGANPGSFEFVYFPFTLPLSHSGQILTYMSGSRTKCHPKQTKFYQKIVETNSMALKINCYEVEFCPKNQGRN
jgi:hypothetical protein